MSLKNTIRNLSLATAAAGSFGVGYADEGLAMSEVKPSQTYEAQSNHVESIKSNHSMDTNKNPIEYYKKPITGHDNSFKNTQYRYYFTNARENALNMSLNDIMKRDEKGETREGKAQYYKVLELQNTVFNDGESIEGVDISLNNVQFGKGSALSTSARSKKQLEQKLQDEDNSNSPIMPQVQFSARNSKLPEALFFNSNTKIDIDLKTCDLSQVRSLNARVDQLTPDMIKAMPNLEKIDFIVNTRAMEAVNFAVDCKKAGVDTSKINMTVQHVNGFMHYSSMQRGLSNEAFQSRVNNKFNKEHSEFNNQTEHSPAPPRLPEAAQTNVPQTNAPNPILASLFNRAGRL